MAAAIETIRAGDSIDTRVKKIIVFSLDCLEDQITNGSRFEIDLRASSAGLKGAHDLLCEEFQMDIPDDLFEKIHTVQELIDYIKAHTPQ